MVQMFRLITLLSTFFLFFHSNAQEFKRLDLYTRHQIQEGKFAKDHINLFVKGNLELIKLAAKKFNVHYKYGYKNIAAVNVPLAQFDAFTLSPGIEYVENADVPIIPLAENAILLNNILPVHNGQSPLNQPYKGDGVIMGVIDDGIDFLHADFRNDDSSTRIRFLWDQRVAAVNSPQPYNYGREWTASEIDAGLSTHVEPANKFGHGTTVSGIAAGNGKATGRFVGMAPNTDIIVVSINSNGDFISTVTDGVDYIFKKADALGKPCVINISQGTYWGSRDGKDLASQMVDLLLEERGGRVVVAAAGNAGDVKFHLAYEVNQDTSFTWFKIIPSEGDLFLTLWADTADFNQVEFAFAADDLSNTSGTFKKATPFINVKRNYNLQPGIINDAQRNFFLTDSLGANIGTILTEMRYAEGRYSLQAIIQPQSATDVWRFMTTGFGFFDIWSSQVLMNASNMIAEFPVGLDTSLVKGIKNYKFPDNQKSMVSSIQSSDKVITVANYQNNEWFLNACGDTTFTGIISGERAKESSLGPTRDNRQKPDIAATGAFTLSVGNRSNINSLLNTNQCNKVSNDSLHQTNGGTSMASPVVAGAAALLLQQNPEAFWFEIKSKLIASAKKDSFTGNNLPDNKWGYGKLDAFAAFSINAAFGCTNPNALNFNASADFDDGTCILPIVGCMNPNALNYDSLANVPDSCVFFQNFTGIYDAKKNAQVSLYPNPAEDLMTLHYFIDNFKSGEIKIYDLKGSLVFSQPITKHADKIKIKTTNLTSGNYILSISQNGLVIAEKKFFKF